MVWIYTGLCGSGSIFERRVVTHRFHAALRHRHGIAIAVAICLVIIVSSSFIGELSSARLRRVVTELLPMKQFHVPHTPAVKQ